MREQLKRGQARRGATLVLVAIMLLVTGGMAALAIDFARAYSGVNEMQTSADASALAGAHHLWRTGTNAVTATQAFAASNSAFGSPTSLAADQVEGGFYDPVTGGFTAGSWTTANAVRVTVSRTTGSGFARLLGLAALTPTRRAVAWIGNQASQDCIKPWGISSSYLSTLLGGISPTSQAGINLIRANNTTNAPAGQYAMTVVVGPDITNPRGSPTTPPSVFLALTGTNSSRKEYQDAIIGQACDGVADYTVGNAETTIQTQPGQGSGDIPRTTANSVEGDVNGNQANIDVTCRPQTNVRDATCYDPALPGNVAGINITVAAVTPTGTNSATINMLMGFRLMCVFRGGNGNQPGASSAQEVCPWLTAAGRTANNYTQGTLVGYPVPLTAVTGRGNSLGNTLSTNQKLVLVR
jgi:hypothetical protein